MRTTLCTMMITISLAVAAAGCMDSPPGDEMQSLLAPLVSADRGGAHVDIYQLTPGNLAVVATGDLPDAVEGKTPVEIYEAIAAAPAPAALVDSQARITAARALHAGDHGGPLTNVATPERSDVSNLTASDFRAQYCNPGPVDFDFCWPNSTNDYSITFFNIKWIHMHLNVISGSLTVSMSYRSALGSWHVIQSDNIGTGLVLTYDDQDNGDYELSLTNATGDVYHLSLHGDR